MSDAIRAPERALVERVREGDRRAFETIFRTHYADLLGFATAMLRSPDAAEDVVQAVFYQIWKRQTTWTVTGTVRAYLFGAVRHRCLNELASTRTRTAREQDAAAAGMPAVVPAPALDPSRRIEAEEARTILRDAIAALPERARLCVELRWRQGLSRAEVADAMGISVKGVEIQLTRAIKALRALLPASIR